MAGILWWRSWHGAPTDHKWPVIAARSGVKVGIVSAIAWALMDYASQQPDRGSVVGFDTEEYAVYSGFEEVEITAVIQAMTDKEIIVNGRLANWDKRQPKREDDNSTERVRKFREMKRNETQGNAPEKEKDKESDKDKDKEEEKREEVPSSSGSAFDDMQRIIERTTGILPTGPAGINAINDLVKAGATADDIKAGYQWLTNNKITFQYYSQLVGPTKTAIAKRIQAAHPVTPQKMRTLTGAHGEKIQVPE